MKTILRIAFLNTILLLVLISCSSSDNTVPITDDDDTDPIGDTDPIPTQTSTYTAHVQPIIEAQCIRCHSNPPTDGAPMPLTTFQNVVDAANTRDLAGRVSTNISRNVMPSDTGRMQQSTIDIILDWEFDGLLLE